MSEQRFIPFDVHIPNIHGDGIAETITIQVPVVRDIDLGEDILTAQAHALIDRTKFNRITELYKKYGQENERLIAQAKRSSDAINEAKEIISRFIAEQETGSAPIQIAVFELKCLRDWIKSGTGYNRDDAQDEISRAILNRIRQIESTTTKPKE